MPAADKAYLEVHPLTQDITLPTPQVWPKQHWPLLGKKPEWWHLFVFCLKVSKQLAWILMLSPWPPCPTQTSLMDQRCPLSQGTQTGPLSPPEQTTTAQGGSWLIRRGLTCSLSWSRQLRNGASADHCHHTSNQGNPNETPEEIMYLQGKQAFSLSMTHLKFWTNVASVKPVSYGPYQHTWTSQQTRPCAGMNCLHSLPQKTSLNSLFPSHWLGPLCVYIP